MIRQLGKNVWVSKRLKKGSQPHINLVEIINFVPLNSNITRLYYTYIYTYHMFPCQRGNHVLGILSVLWDTNLGPTPTFKMWIYTQVCKPKKTNYEAHMYGTYAWVTILLQTPPSPRKERSIASCGAMDCCFCESYTKRRCGRSQMEGIIL